MTAKVSVLDVQPAKQSRYDQAPNAGDSYYGVLARFCLTRNDNTNDITISNDYWTLRFPDGTVSQASLISTTLHPDYPDGQVIPVGTCGMGWLYFEGPTKPPPNLVVYAPQAPGVRAITFPV